MVSRSGPFSLRGAAPRWWLLLAALTGLSLYVYAGERGHDGDLTVFTGGTMGTTYRVTLGEPQTQTELARLERAVKGRLADINARMSTYDPDSELSRFNRHASTEPFSVSEPVVDVLKMARGVSRASGGAFDVTVGPLVDAWGFGPSGRPRHAPTQEELAKLRERVGYTKLRLRDRQLEKTHPRLQVDLSAIAKGYAVDRVAELLERKGQRDYLVEIGGELRARGHSVRGRPFRVGIEEPDPERRAVHTAIALEGSAMATSGNYRNHFELEGRHYVHTLHPRTGRPIRHRLLSATVLHDRCALADAWATALMAAGPETAWQLADAVGLDVLLLVGGKKGGIVERATAGFEARRLDKPEPQPQDP